MYWLIIVAFILIFYLYSEYNTKRFCVNGKAYNSHNNYANKEEAAKTLAELDRRMKKVRDCMRKKYTCGKTKCTKIIKFGLDEIYINDRINQFGGNEIFEISPNNPLSSTSFTEGKKKMVFCIRDKKSGEIHDINILTFVALHEMAHVMNDHWGHGNKFWELFYIILNDAVECGVYIPVDYSKNPVDYCGLRIDNNPLFLI